MYLKLITNFLKTIADLSTMVNCKRSDDESNKIYKNHNGHWYSEEIESICNGADFHRTLKEITTVTNYSCLM